MKKRLRKKMSKDWGWYAVKVLYECNISGNPSSETMEYNTHKTFEESIILIKAPSIVQAYIFGEKEAIKAEVDYLNVYGERLEWKYIETIDCFNLCDEKLQSGTELYARFLRVPREITNKEVISHYYPETVVEEVDYNFIPRCK